MKSISILIAASMMLLSSVQVNAQRSLNWCGTDQAYLELLRTNPEYRASREAQEQADRAYINSNPAPVQKTSGVPIYTIPVVFHVIHNYGYENIPKSRILLEMDYINKSFQNQWADTANVNPVFKPIQADAQIEFKLAQIDPNGNCTDGITRTVSNLTYSAGENVKSLVKWPYSKYLNVWVVANIASGAAGYSFYPGANNNGDGVVIGSSFVGSTGSNYDQRVLTHEIGHWLNLAHTWGGTNDPGLAQNCSNDDFVMDTPNTIGVSNFSCNYNQTTCNTLDNVENYMDYAGCSYMFTDGQKDRMHNALNNSAGSRNNLSTPANLTATGTDPGFIPTACALIPDFNGATKYLCAGETVDFADLSYNGDATGWQWDVPGGTPSVSFDQNPTITYNTSGVYDVTLTVTNASGSYSLTRSSLVYVSSSPGANAAPFLEDFENTGPIPSGSEWVIDNPAGNNAWELSTAAAFSGTHSMRLLNHSGNNNNIYDAFVTPGYDFTNITNANMTFQLSFAARSTSSTDQLKVYASSTCGEQWALRYTKSGLNLSTAGIVTSSFIPNSTSQWRQESVNVSGVSYNNKPNVRFKFEYVQNTGNNIYVDDINITGTSTIGIKDVKFLATLNLFPNPSQTGTELVFSLSEDADILITVSDITGRTLEILENSKLAIGDYRYTFGDQYSAGVYFVKISAGANDISKKLVLTR